MTTNNTIDLGSSALERPTPTTMIPSSTGYGEQEFGGRPANPRPEPSAPPVGIGGSSVLRPPFGNSNGQELERVPQPYDE